MANNLTNEGERRLALALTTGFPVPPAAYVGLWTTTLTEASTGATAGEVSGTNYNRVPIVWGDPVLTGNVYTVTNTVETIFPSAGGSWGTVLSLGFLDSPLAGQGNMLMYHVLGSGLAVALNNRFRIQPNVLTITID